MKSKNFFKSVLLVLGISLLTVLCLHFSFPEAKAQLASTSSVAAAAKKNIHYTAVGDSLTEGVGDTLKSGGFVPLVAQALEEDYPVQSVEIDNYGVSGDRSDQILKRIKQDEKLQEDVTSADIITLTVGGNDIMKVIKNNVFGLKTSSFKRPMKNYQAHLTEIFKQMRSLNKTAPIYVVGVYNPFYINFPDITEMQTIIENWDDATKKVISQESNAYFVAINDTISKGTEDSNALHVTEDSTDNDGDLNTVRNKALYEEDNFHPNTTGYQLMTREIMQVIKKSPDVWLEKGSASDAGK